MTLRYARYFTTAFVRHAETEAEEGEKNASCPNSSAVYIIIILLPPYIIILYRLLVRGRRLDDAPLETVRLTTAVKRNTRRRRETFAKKNSKKKSMTACRQYDGKVERRLNT